MMPNLGRGGSLLEFYPHIVRKRVSSVWEPLYMAANPRIFCPIIEVHRDGDSDDYWFTMTRGVPVIFPPSRMLIFDAVRQLRTLWEQVTNTDHHEWRPQLVAHLQKILATDPPRLECALTWVKTLPIVDVSVNIHGDATLANVIVFDGWHTSWIDPLRRSYIPGHPAVDIGKIFQSVLGYEHILVHHTWHEGLVDESLLEDIAGCTTVDYDLCLVWCYIHLARALRYQAAEDRPALLQVMDHIGDML